MSEVPMFDQHAGSLSTIGMVWEYNPLTDYWAGYLLRRQENAMVQMQEVHHVLPELPYCLHCLSNDMVYEATKHVWEICLECGLRYYIDYDHE